MKLIIVNKIHKANFFIHVNRMSNRIFMMEDVDRRRSGMMSMKSTDNVKSQLKRCRVLMVVNTFKSIFNWQIMMARRVEE